MSVRSIPILAFFISATGMPQSARLTPQDSLGVIAAIARHANGRALAGERWLVPTTDSVWVGALARAARAEVAFATDTTRARCYREVPLTSSIGNRASVELRTLSADSAEVRVTLRCTGGIDPARLQRHSSVLIYALRRRDGAWSVSSLRARAG